ncbi:unnamed protein product [Closterium sp. NIES-54]
MKGLKIPPSSTSSPTMHISASLSSPLLASSSYSSPSSSSPPTRSSRFRILPISSFLPGPSAESSPRLHPHPLVPTRQLFLCWLFSFLRWFKPSEPFLVDFMVSKGLSNADVYHKVFPVWVFSQLPALLLVSLLSKLIGCKSTVAIGAILGFATTALTIAAPTVTSPPHPPSYHSTDTAAATATFNATAAAQTPDRLLPLTFLQTSQVTFALSFAAHSAFAALSLASLPRSHYTLASHGNHAATLAGSCLSGLLGRVMARHVSLLVLFIVSLVCQFLSVVVAVLLRPAAADVGLETEKGAESRARTREESRRVSRNKCRAESGGEKGADTRSEQGHKHITSVRYPCLTLHPISTLLRSILIATASVAADVCHALTASTVLSWSCWAILTNSVHRMVMTYWLSLVKELAMHQQQPSSLHLVPSQYAPVSSVASSLSSSLPSSLSAPVFATAVSPAASHVGSDGLAAGPGGMSAIAAASVAAIAVVAASGARGGITGPALPSPPLLNVTHFPFLTPPAGSLIKGTSLIHKAAPAWEPTSLGLRSAAFELGSAGSNSRSERSQDSGLGDWHRGMHRRMLVYSLMESQVVAAEAGVATAGAREWTDAKASTPRSLLSGTAAAVSAAAAAEATADRAEAAAGRTKVAADEEVNGAEAAAVAEEEAEEEAAATGIAAAKSEAVSDATSACYILMNLTAALAIVAAAYIPVNYAHTLIQIVSAFVCGLSLVTTSHADLSWVTYAALVVYHSLHEATGAVCAARVAAHVRQSAVNLMQIPSLATTEDARAPTCLSMALTPEVVAPAIPPARTSAPASAPSSPASTLTLTPSPLTSTNVPTPTPGLRDLEQQLTSLFAATAATSVVLQSAVQAGLLLFLGGSVARWFLIDGIALLSLAVLLGGATIFRALIVLVRG